MLPFSINELYVQPLYQSAFCWQPLLQLVFVLLLATVLNNLLYPVALKGIQPTTASIYINLQPIIASVVAILIGQDIFSWDEPVSAILVISGVLLVSHSQIKIKLICGSVFIGRTPGHFLEPTAEVLRIWKSKFIGYFTYGLRRIEYPLFSDIEHFLLDVFQGRHSRFFFIRSLK